jgi:phenylalanyl-tRNA synthetase beta subunit
MARANKSRTVSVEVNVGYVDVEIDLSEIETKDLLEELKSRDVKTHLTSVELEDIYKQFAFGNESQAVNLTKQHIENTIGRIVP